uniref:Uncharacterized protein n=1 Tax=Chelonoidis abingdonii TaxID=106734 RepID=A0A8C0JIE4_CHEAB
MPFSIGTNPSAELGSQRPKQRDPGLAWPLDLTLRTENCEARSPLGVNQCHSSGVSGARSSSGVNQCHSSGVSGARSSSGVNQCHSSGVSGARSSSGVNQCHSSGVSGARSSSGVNQCHSSGGSDSHGVPNPAKAEREPKTESCSLVVNPN